MESVSKNGRPPLAWMWWLPALVWSAGIFYLSTKTGDDVPKFDFPHLDKIVHFVLYAVLAHLFFAALRFGHGARFGVAVLLGLVLASLYGVTDEYHQTFTSGRAQDVMDWVADTCGAATVLLAPLLRPKEPSHI